jgi:hypothetical protein
MLGPSVFWMHGGFILQFDMCGEKLRVKTFSNIKIHLAKSVNNTKLCRKQQRRK